MSTGDGAQKYRGTHSITGQWLCCFQSSKRCATFSVIGPSP